MNQSWKVIRGLGLVVAAACANEIPNDVDSLALALDGQGEVIEVSSCSPGFLQLGEGSSMVCLPDPSWSSPPPDYPSPDYGDEFGGGAKPGRGGARPKPAPKKPASNRQRPCRTADLQSPSATECVIGGQEDIMNNRLTVRRVICRVNGVKECCALPNEGVQVPGVVGTCEEIE